MGGGRPVRETCPRKRGVLASEVGNDLLCTLRTRVAPARRVPPLRLRRSWLAGLLSVIVACGCGGSDEDRPESRKAIRTVVPPGEVLGTFDVGGRKLNLRCYGSGSPVVVFEAAHTVDSSAYLNLARQVGDVTQACAYDRANLGLSDPRSGSRDGLDVVTDLTALLAAAKVSGPYVLVGHSFGGVLTLLYAAERPDDVLGLVLLDAAHPDTEAEFATLIPSRDRRRFNAADQRREPLDLDAASAQLHARLGNLPHVPMTVVTATRFDDLPPDWPRRKMKRVWLRHQKEYAAMIPGARQVMADTHQHDIWVVDPLPVIEEIKAVVQAAREQRG